MGLVCALVYLLALILFLPFVFKRDIVEVTSRSGTIGDILEAQDVENGRFLHRFPLDKVTFPLYCDRFHHANVLQLASYGFAYGTLAFQIILGILDDSFDMRWRHKFFIPAFAVLPTLALYFVSFGVTHVVIPLPLRPYFGELIDLGLFYYVYMAAVAIFCPNSINMLAGINGIEVAQSVVIALMIILNDSLYLLPTIHQPHPAADAHLFSVYLLVPFVGISLALLKYNWYPARVFVGDTYCYFAGMVFAVVGILGHFSKTLLLLFIPQIFNFVYSTPQLFKLVPCPRHRLPSFNARTGLLEPSVATFSEDKPLSPAIGEVMKLLHQLNLLRVKTDGKGRVTESTNFTLLNLWLVWRGPLKEDRLAIEMLIMQAVVGVGGLYIRHSMGRLLFNFDNRF